MAGDTDISGIQGIRAQDRFAEAVYRVHPMDRDSGGASQDAFRDSLDRKKKDGEEEKTESDVAQKQPAEAVLEDQVILSSQVMMRVAPPAAKPDAAQEDQPQPMPAGPKPTDAPATTKSQEPAPEKKPDSPHVDVIA